MTEPVWTPTAEQVASARMTAFIEFVRDQRARGAPGAELVRDYPSLYQWSVERPNEFWPAVMDFCGVVHESTRTFWEEPGTPLDVLAPPADGGARWFPTVRLNFAENLLRFRDQRTAIVFWNERGRQRALTYADLAADVARVAASLRAAGVGVGDRVAGWLPNLPETVVAMLATASLGAVWSSCSPDFGVKGVLDRFGQIRPKVLIAADGYRYAGKEVDCLDRLAAIAAGLPSVECVVVVEYLGTDADLSRVRDSVRWTKFAAGAPGGERRAARVPGKPGRPPEEFGERRAPIPFARLPFDHPLYIMYSSGTTGLPKCVVHGAGGTLVQHLKELVLHADVTRRSRVFYFTTCGWMMWNWVVSSLAVGATLVLYDGAPLAPEPTVLWDMAAAERVTVFGTSARYLAMCEKAGLRPAETHDLSALDSILSTGSPLGAHSYDYVRERVKPGVRLSSISGGTDIISCFALGNPIAPVWRGELQTRGLGMAVEVWDEHGRPVRGQPGELVCTRPFPSMPVGFWDDRNGAKYRAAYFEHFAGAWRHGDWAELTEHDGLVIHGRSDATLNPGGVRIGTAEIYRQVEQLPEIVESVVVGQEVGDGAARNERIVLFVRLRDGAVLDEALRERVRRQLRDHASPHHVPRRIVQVADIPRTISGKIVELAVRDVVHGRPVKNVDALANPDALELFRDVPELLD